MGRGADPPPGDRRRPRVRPRARHRPQGHQTRERAHRRRLGREARRFRPRRRRRSAPRESLQASIYQTEDAEGKAVAGRYVRCRQGTAFGARPAGSRSSTWWARCVHGPGGSHASGPELPGGCLRVCDLNRGDDHRGGALRGSRAKRRARAHGPGRELQRGGPRQGDRERGVEAVASRGGRGGVLWASPEANGGDDDDAASAWAPSAAMLRGLVERGWSADPNARPTFGDVQKDLDAIAAAYRASGGRLARVWRPPSGGRTPRRRRRGPQLASRVWKLRSAPEPTPRDSRR